MKPFSWTTKKEQVAFDLANGYTIAESAGRAGVSERTIYNWKKYAEFIEEIDRLSLMTDVATRAERLRIAKRVIRSLGYESGKDLLEWLKYAQGETDGLKLDLAALAEITAD